MSAQTWKLIDDEQDLHVGPFRVDPDQVTSAPKSFSVRLRTLQGGLRHGVDVIEINNGKFRFTVVPTRGMGIWKGWLGETELGWKSPRSRPGPPQPRSAE